MSRSRSLARAAGFAVALLTASGAPAGDFYFATDVGLAAQSASSGGTNERFTPTPNSGDDGDSTPVFGGAFGFEFPLVEALPWEIPVPGWMAGEGVRFPDWRVRLEIEGRYRLDSEFLTDGISPATPYRSQLSTWTAFQNVWMHFPVHPPFEAVFGRIPILEPLSIYTGVGIGLATSALTASDTVASGKDRSLGFAWQAGGGLSYALTDWAHISLGYRYIDLGSLDVDLDDGGIDSGNFSLDLVSHEVTTGLRFDFYSVRFPD